MRDSCAAAISRVFRPRRYTPGTGRKGCRAGTQQGREAELQRRVHKEKRRCCLMMTMRAQYCSAAAALMPV